MKKLLATGLIASVAMSSAEASNDCDKVRGFIMSSFGLSSTKMKYKNDLAPQEYVLVKEETEKMRIDRITTLAARADLFKADEINDLQSRQNIDKTSSSKRKDLFQFGIGFGADKRFGSVMLGITCNFGKNFGNVKKKEKGLELTKYYNGEFAAALPQAILAAANLAAQPVQHAAFPYDDAPIDYAGNTPLCVIKRTVDNEDLYSRNLELEFKCQNKYYISFMPRIGTLISPKLELYVTAGFKIKSDKYTITRVDNKKSEKKTVTKCIPSVGFGLQQNFQNGAFVNLSCIFDFKAKKKFRFKANNKLDMDSTVKQSLQNSSKEIKLGFGRRF